jgi:ADP-ribose pyrophosphatase YjhB (NUDIX family)
MGTSIGVFGIIQVKKEIVLVRHAYKEKKLSLPGGGLETGEIPDVAMDRESFEETNLRVRFKHIGTYFLRKSPGCLYLFLGKAESLSGDPITCPKEISEVMLVDPACLPEDVYPAQRKMIERWMRNDLGKRGLYPFDLL